VAPFPPRPRPPTLEADSARFWSRVDKRRWNQCWPWLGTIHPIGGHGQLYIAGRNRRAQRVAWELHYGKSEGRNVLHKCNNPNCVNPRHLYLGTQRDNLLDAVKAKTHGMTRKTYCKRGHKLTKANTYSRPGTNWRECRICRQERTRRPRKTHCKNGHEFTAANTYRFPSKPSVRVCRICLREQKLRYRQRKRANAV